MNCEFCQRPGQVSQGPWNLPISLCLCNYCFALESIAFNAWHDLYPNTDAPIPLIKKTGNPPNMEIKDLKPWFKKKFNEINHTYPDQIH